MARVHLHDTRLAPSALEPRAAIGQWDEPTHRYTLTASTQGVAVVRRLLAEETGLEISAPADPFQAQGSRDALVELSGELKVVAVSMIKIANDLALMGSGPQPAARSKGPRAGGRVSPALTDLATRLSDRFETRVKVDLGQKKGKIVVEFASMEDLERILGSLAPGEGQVLQKGLTAHAPEDEQD